MLDTNKTEETKKPSSLAFGVVCSSNMNRSMEAHLQFEKENLAVFSYGVGNKIRLPGKFKITAENDSNQCIFVIGPAGQSVFEFGTAYADIKSALISTGYEDWYRDRGLLKLLERNIKIKEGPERFQDCDDVDKLDVVFCFETRVFDILVENLESRRILNFDPIYVMNLDVTDNADEAEVGAKLALELCQRLEKLAKEGVFEEEVFEVVNEVEQKYNRAILCKICYL